MNIRSWAQKHGFGLLITVVVLLVVIALLAPRALLHKGPRSFDGQDDFRGRSGMGQNLDRQDSGQQAPLPPQEGGAQSSQTAQ